VLAPLERSTDFGATWTECPRGVSAAHAISPSCPARRTSSSSRTASTGLGRGRHFKSTDGGYTFTVTDSTPNGTSELPGLACARLRSNQVIGTAGSRAASRARWTGLDMDDRRHDDAAWGVDISRDDPNVVVFAQYSNSNGPPLGYISLDGGQSYSSIPAAHAVQQQLRHLCRDRATILAEQSSGIWKLQNNLRLYARRADTGAAARRPAAASRGRADQRTRSRGPRRTSAWRGSNTAPRRPIRGS
jgi:hypothetical protein